MKKTIALLAFAASALCLCAGGNLLKNGRFEAEQSKFPLYWIIRPNLVGTIEYFKNGGPDNLPYVKIKVDGDIARLQQNGLWLLRNEKYIISAWIRTKGLVNKASGLRAGGRSFANDGPNALSGLPVDQPEWRYYSKLITIGYEDAPFYTFDIAVEGPSGEIDVADVSLRPATENARLNSLSQDDGRVSKLVPLGLLHYISAQDPFMEFCWVGRFPGDRYAADCEFTFSRSGKSVKVPYQDKRFRVDFGKAAQPGRQKMTARILSRTGRELYRKVFDVTVRELPAPAPAAKKINNMVTELYSGRVQDGAVIDFANPAYGWLYFSAPGKGKFTVTLDGKELFSSGSPRREMIRQMEPGKYQLRFSGDRSMLRIRMIPDILVFCLWGPCSPGNGIYNWEFGKKYVVPGLTTLTNAALTKEDYAELKAMGRILLIDTDFGADNNPDNMLKKLERDPKLKRQAMNDGCTLDEADIWFPPRHNAAVYSIENFRNIYRKHLVTYVCGPFTPSYSDLLSAAANASSSHGHAAAELYLCTQKNEDLARRSIRQIARHWDIARGVAPELISRTGIVLGAFGSYPKIMLQHHPEVNFKRHLDIQLNEIVNNPSFDGVRALGYYGCHAADEETFRWCFKLMRHYIFEGRRDMLSDQYGYKYLSGHLKNCDFDEGFKEWQITGPAKMENLPGYGRNFQHRYVAPLGRGDNFVLMSRTEKEFCTVSQTATGLQKGKLYQLYFFVADYDLILNHDPKAGVLPLDAELKGAEIIQQDCGTGIFYNGDKPKPNYRRIIFRANAENMELKFSNPKAALGSRLMLNYISLHPYFEPAELK